MTFRRAEVKENRRRVKSPLALKQKKETFLLAGKSGGLLTFQYFKTPVMFPAMSHFCHSDLAAHMKSAKKASLERPEKFLIEEWQLSAEQRKERERYWG